MFKNGLSADLKNELAIDSYLKMFEGADIFRNFSNEFLKQLTYKVKEMIKAPGEYIVPKDYQVDATEVDPRVYSLKY